MPSQSKQPPNNKNKNKKKKNKGHAPAHQNSFAFRHNPKSKLTEKILSSPNVGVCRRCHEKIEWRKKYRKYKPRTQPGTCNLCRKRNVTAAYHTICRSCAKNDAALTKVEAAVMSVAVMIAEKSQTMDDDDGDDDDGDAPAYEEQEDVDDIEIDDGGDDEDDQLAENPTETDHEEEEEEESRNSLNSNTKKSEPTINKGKRRGIACAVCVSDYALPPETDGTNTAAAEILAQDHAGLKLRERRALHRQAEKIQKQEQEAKKAAKEAREIGEDGNDDDGDGDDKEEGIHHDEDYEDDDMDSFTHESASRLDDDDDDDEANDPFLAAIGGSNNFVIGEAYQKKLLEQAQRT